MKIYLFLAAGIVALALLAGCFVFGMRYEAGREAEATLTTTRATLKATRDDLASYHTRLQAAAAQFATDSAALHAIAEDYTHARTEQLHFAASLRTRLDAWLAHHPAAGACGLDADGLKLWNDANRGVRAQRSHAGAGAAAGAARRGVARAVSAAAAGHQPQAAGADAQPSGHHGDLSRLREGQGGPHPRGQDARGAAGGQAPARAASGARASILAVPRIPLIAVGNAREPAHA